MKRRPAWTVHASAGVMLAALLGVASATARAEAGWFESGDAMLRMDLQLLNDADVIRLPVNEWPIPRAAVSYAIDNAKVHFVTNAEVSAALGRVRAKLEPSAAWRLSASANAGQSGRLRDFDDVAREDGELGATASYRSDRFAAGLRVTAVSNPDDGEEFRLDGSHATVQLGNWLFSANALDRWWGPGHESSLILSSNARPMPTLMVARAAAKPFETPWLSWLGPWRLSFGISQMEQNRADIDAPLFMAWRVAAMPFKKIEVGLSRTAQFCGEQLPCNSQSIQDMLLGHDNKGKNVALEDEPGNQMAGFDIRWNSPIGNFPYAIYSQFIGEDVSAYVPVKYLKQFGLETWKPLSAGGLVQGYLEYATSECANKHGLVKDCAYNQGLFNVEGYRYRGRVIGYTTDRDAQTWTLGGTYTDSRGNLWTAKALDSRLAIHSDNDTRNTVAVEPTHYNSLELGWKGALFGEPVSIDLGYELYEPTVGARDSGPFGFVGWRHEFKP